MEKEKEGKHTYMIYKDEKLYLFIHYHDDLGSFGMCWWSRVYMFKRNFRCATTSCSYEMRNECEMIRWSVFRSLIPRFGLQWINFTRHVGPFCCPPLSIIKVKVLVLLYFTFKDEMEARVWFAGLAFHFLWDLWCNSTTHLSMKYSQMLGFWEENCMWDFSLFLLIQSFPCPLCWIFKLQLDPSVNPLQVNCTAVWPLSTFSLQFLANLKGGGDDYYAWNKIKSRSSTGVHMFLTILLTLLYLTDTKTEWIQHKYGLR